MNHVGIVDAILTADERTFIYGAVTVIRQYVGDL